MGKPSQVEPHDPDPGAPAALPTDGLSQPAAMPGVPPELEVLARTARAVAAAEGSEGLAAVIEAVRSLLGAPGAALLRCARARLEPVASYGLEPQAGVMAEAGFSAAAERQGSPHGGYPLRFGGVLEGVLLLAGVDANHLGQQEARLMPLLDLAAIALRNARLTAERSHALAVANRLVDVGQLLASNLDPEAVARAVAEAAVDLLGAEQVGLVLPNEAGILRFTVCAGRCDERVRAYRFKPGEGIVGRAYAEARAYRVDDLWAAPRSTSPELDQELGTRSFLAVPVLDVHGQPLGVLMAARNEPGAFTGEEQHLLERLADLTAVALQNARLSARVHAEAAERRRAVEALRESEARFRAVFDRAPVGLSISAPDLRVLALNPAFEQMLGYTIDELNQLGHRGYNHPDDVEEQYRLHAELIKGQRDFYELEKRYRRKDGRWIWAHVVISAIRDEDGQILFVLGMVEDITARREAEQQRLVLAQTEKFRVLGQMASGAAHDLNQYLGLVAGHGEIALNALAGVGVGAAALGEGGYSSGWRALESARESLRIIVQAAFDGAETVRRLQTFTRPQGEGPGEAFAVGALLREVAELTAPRWRVEAQRFGRTIDVDVVEAGDTTIVGWQSSLREALTNLVFNAVDALPGRAHPARRRAAGRPRRGDGSGHRHRHDRRSEGSGVRAVLHHEGRARHRAWLVDGLRGGRAPPG